jgi:hypothetical protein
MQLEVPKFDQLANFTDWYQRQPFAVPMAPAFGVNKVGAFTGLTLFRQGRFQVQLWLCDPNSEIPDHSHPNVDSIQVYVSGQVYLRLNGEVVIKPEDVREDMNGLNTKAAFWMRVGPGDVHGATIGPKGGAFITFQHWLRGDPESVENDWEGEPIDAEHAQRIGAGEPAGVPEVTNTP